MKLLRRRRVPEGLSLSRACRLLKVVRSVVYHSPCGESEENLGLLEHFKVSKPNQVWCADITYIRAKGGFAYGVAIMDMYSRKVLAFEISNTMDEWMCVKAAKKALARCGKPRVIHTQGKAVYGEKLHCFV